MNDSVVQQVTRIGWLPIQYHVGKSIPVSAQVQDGQIVKVLEGSPGLDVSIYALIRHMMSNKDSVTEALNILRGL